MTPVDALTRSYERFRSSVQRAAEDVVRDPDEASDVASEAFLALLEQGPHDETVHLSWLRTTARNRALNRMRRLRRHVPLADHDAAVADREPLEGVRELVATALVRLPDRDRTALESRIVREESYEEVAGGLGVSTEQAHLIVHRASIRLRREIIRGLAEAHDAPETCTRNLIHRFAESRETTAHTHCKPCASVGDEIAALRTTASNLAVLPLATPGLFDRFAGLLQRARGMVDRPRGQAVAATLAIAVSLGGGAVAPVRPTPGIAPGTPRAGAPAVSELAAGLTAPASVSIPGTAASVDPSAFTMNAADPDGDASTLPLLRLVNPLLVPDAIGAGTRRADLDARSFSIRTLMIGGRSAGLRFDLVTVLEPLEKGGRFKVTWQFESANQCSATLTVKRRALADPDGTLMTSCRFNSLRPTPNEEEVRLPVSIDGTTMTVTVPYRALGTLGRALHHSGAHLIAMTAMLGTQTQQAQSAPTGQQLPTPDLDIADRVPNDGTLSYTIW